MTIGPFIDMQGAVDVHIHSEPDLFPRIADDVGVARHAVSLGLRAVSLKCHSERTTSRAYMTMQTRAGDPGGRRHRAQPRGGRDQPGRGGGGAPARGQAHLDANRRRGLPRAHVRLHRRVRQAGEHRGQVRGSRHRGVRRRRHADRRTDRRARSAPPSTRAILSTCHLSVPEIKLLVKTARERGVEKIMITHPFFKGPGTRARATSRTWSPRAPMPSSVTARSPRCGTTRRSPARWRRSRSWGPSAAS